MARAKRPVQPAVARADSASAMAVKETSHDAAPLGHADGEPTRGSDVHGTQEVQQASRISYALHCSQLLRAAVASGEAIRFNADWNPFGDDSAGHAPEEREEWSKTTIAHVPTASLATTGSLARN